MLSLRITISVILTGVLSSLGSDCAPEGTGDHVRLMHREPSSTGPNFPKGASAYNLTIPTDLSLKAVAVGVGTQNYTCSLASGTPTWTLVGAMAHLRDITNAEEDPAEIAKAAAKKDSRKVLSQYTRIAKHYFIPHEQSAAPAFFFDPNKNRLKSASIADNYVIVAKIGSMPAPNHPKRNVPWLALKRVEGNAARLAFRTNTHFGVPPPESACTQEGEHSNMGYSALYWFYH
ncbi:hypothetical protein DFH28DRAFT_1087264 [Melampsora americana]|nr:hypothetical protein DFH28DRAFT_1087264 [Melampsora americana]